jgi:hypothetical protein
MATATMAMAQEGPYPVRLEILEIPYPENLSRGLVLVKWLLAIPHLIILYFLTYAYYLTSLIAAVAILFTTQYPRGLFKFNVGVRRWQANVNAYTWLLRDEYPPFSFDPGQYPVAFEVDYPENMNRFLPLVKWLLAIPHVLVLLFAGTIALIFAIIAFFAILITGKYPQSLFNFVVGRLRWYERAWNYIFFATDVYPPFRLSP